MGLFSVLALIFTVLKVADLIAWSWWWLPVIFLGDVIIALLFLGGFATLASILSIFSRKK